MSPLSTCFSTVEYRSKRRIAVVCAVALSIMPACVIVPVRLPTQVRGISGNRQKLDLIFLKAGFTKREEVVSRLASIDTHADQPEFFWGRWESSKWAVGGIVALPPIAGAAGGSRLWSAHNLLVAFDHNGTVKSWVAVNDHKLLPLLDFLDSGSTERLDLPDPLYAKVLLAKNSQDDQENPTADLILSADFLECSDVRVSPAQIQRITTAEQAIRPSPGYIWINLHLQRNRRFGTSFSIGVDPPTLLLLRHYVKTAHERERPKAENTTFLYTPPAWQRRQAESVLSTWTGDESLLEQASRLLVLAAR